MDADRWRLVTGIFAEALELAESERPAFLEKACGGDSQLRAEVDSLIAAAHQGAWLDNAAVFPETRTVANPGTTDLVVLAAGTKFGPYLISRKLGQGGMGVVYHATDSRLGRPVALKLLSTADATPSHRTRFAREARAASSLNHPNIATIYEFDTLNGSDFIAMEYVAGVTLHDVLHEKKTPLPQLLEYARQTVRAAGAAHAAGIVHRDLKPGNIMITREGTVKVLDFGLAKIASHTEEGVDETRTMLTRAGAVLGTPSYMSPEQVAGEEVDYRTDIFALGIILYEMVCGERPFRAPNPHSTLHLIATAEPRSVEESNSAAPAPLIALIGRCLRKKKEERLQSMEEAEKELAKLLAPAAESPRQSLSRSPSRRVLLAGGGVIAIALALGGYWFLRPVAVPSVSCFLELRSPDGQAHQASFRDTFDSGTRFRLGAEARQPGFLYIVSGETVLSGGTLPANQRVRTEWLVMEGPPGSDQVWFVWSGHPVDELEHPSHTAAIRAILSKLQAASPQVDGSIELRGTERFIGTQVEIRHR